MSENAPPSPLWPPNRKRKTPPETPLNHSQPSNVSNTHSLPPPSPSPFIVETPAIRSRQPLSNLTPSTNSVKKAKIYRNGYETKAQTPSYKPYSLNSRGHTQQKAFAFGEPTKNAGIAMKEPLSCEEWTELAREAGAIPEGAVVKDFQVQCSNIVIGRTGDVCVVSPTGSGKSLLWLLPLLAQKHGIALVITPYTSLGSECETR